MPFDTGRFQQAEFVVRTERVPVPSLREFFAEGEDAHWEVRGLTASQLYLAMEAKQRQDAVSSIVEALASTGDKAQELRKVLGLSGDVPSEIVKRLEMLVMGSVSPVIDLQTAVKLGQCFPIEFLLLTNAIRDLTGKGFDLVKPPAASHPTQPSTPA
jgi:hypothetical protein